MKNVTIALDDEVHRRARIRAAELGTSLSALVKDYLGTLGSETGPAGPSPGQNTGVREMPLSFSVQPSAPIAAPAGPPYLVDGQWVYTKDGKPRQPGALRGKIGMADDFDTWPDDILASFEAWDYDHEPDKF
ncbi:MAG: hypothetical protein AABZ45_04665 [Pseudomonadota bacterium]